MTNTAVPTNYGRQWNALAFSGQAVPAITEMAFGDGDRIPGGNETTLENEVHRTTLSQTGILAGDIGAFFDGPIGVGIGGFVVREIGLFTDDGKLVAIGRRGEALAVGEEDDFVYRFEVFFEQLEALVVTVDPIHGISGDRRIDADTGLDGGGDLSADRTLKTNWSNLPNKANIAATHSFNLRQGTTQRKVTTGEHADWLIDNLSNASRNDDRLVKFGDLPGQAEDTTLEIATETEVRNSSKDGFADVSDKAIAPDVASKVFLPRLIDGKKNGNDDNATGIMSVIPVVESSMFYGHGLLAQGAFEIAFSNDVSVLNTVMAFSFFIDTYRGVNVGRVEYKIHTYLIGSSNTFGNFSISSVWCSDPAKQKNVRFNYDATAGKGYIYIGETDDIADYPSAVITDLVLRLGSAESDLWAADDAIKVSLQTSFKGTNIYTISGDQRSEVVKVYAGHDNTDFVTSAIGFVPLGNIFTIPQTVPNSSLIANFQITSRALTNSAGSVIADRQLAYFNDVEYIMNGQEAELGQAGVGAGDQLFESAGLVSLFTPAHRRPSSISSLTSLGSWTIRLHGQVNHVGAELQIRGAGWVIQEIANV